MSGNFPEGMSRADWDHVLGRGSVEAHWVEVPCTLQVKSKHDDLEYVIDELDGYLELEHPKYLIECVEPEYVKAMRNKLKTAEAKAAWLEAELERVKAA